MSEQSDSLKRQLDENLRRGRELVASLDEERFNRQPEPGRWSAAECVDHLNVTNESYVRKLRRAVDGAEKRPARGTVGAGIIGGLFRRLMEPPVRQRLPAPKPFTPSGTKDRELLMRRFADVHGELNGLIDEMEGYDWSRVKVRSPVSKRIQFNLAAALAIVAAHERRHLWQAERAAE